jgi:hypothetical protein
LSGSRTWLLGAVAGSLGGLLLLLSGAVLVVLAVVAFAIGAAARPRPFGLAGTLIGWGGAWLALLARAELACAAANARPNEGCVGADPLPYVVLCLCLVGAGLGSLGLGVMRARHDQIT